jgi:hypothetical protein
MTESWLHAGQAASTSAPSGVTATLDGRPPTGICAMRSSPDVAITETTSASAKAAHASDPSGVVATGDEDVEVRCVV